MKLDEFKQNFHSMREMDIFLEELEDASSWVLVSGKGIKTVEAKKIDPTQYTNLQDLELYTDTCGNSGLYQQLTKSSQPYPVRNTAMPSIYGRNRFSGSVFRDLTKKELTSSINTFAKYAKGNTLVRIMGGKISAELSDGYIVLNMKELFQIADNSFTKQFQQVEFVGGYFDYILTTAKWSIRDERITQIYSNLIGQATKDVRCIVKVNTSDTGYSGANIFYQLVEGGRKIYLSRAIRMEHKTGASLEEFTENTKKVLAKIGEALANLERLRNIRIIHPTNCMSAVMKKAGISWKMIGDTVDHRNMVTSQGATNALELYFDVCQCVDLAVANGLHNTRLISDLEEKIASTIAVKWENFDISESISIHP